MMAFPAFFRRLPTLPSAPRMRSGMPLNQSTTLFHVLVTPVLASSKNCLILPGMDLKKLTILLAHVPMKLVKLLHICRPLSVWVKK